MFEINGVVPIVPTPFAPDGSIDWAALEPLLNFAVDAHVCAVCLPAYASEFYKLRDGERRELVCHAIRILNGRLPLVAQINHFATSYVVETARDLERAGASAISVAVPRLFGLPERDLLRYFDRILNAIAVPLIIQDFNPGGATVSLEFVRSLNNQHKHFRYLKLEEPLMSARVQAIAHGTIQAIAHGTKGAVGVVGWGGMYMLELIDSGICGVMPGLAVSDILQNVWKAPVPEKRTQPMKRSRVFCRKSYTACRVLNFFITAEKSLLAARGVLPNAEVRDATLTINEVDRAHIDFLNRKVLELLHSRRNMRTATNLSTKVSA